MSGFRCQVSCVLCQVSAVSCLLSTGPTLSSFMLNKPIQKLPQICLKQRTGGLGHLWTIYCLSESSFTSKSSKHLHSQTVRARGLKFWEDVHCSSPSTCHVSCVMCHMSCVTCKMSLKFLFAGWIHCSCVTENLKIVTHMLHRLQEETFPDATLPIGKIHPFSKNCHNFLTNYAILMSSWD